MRLLYCIERQILRKSEEISFPFFIKKMLMSAFLLRFKANYHHKKMRDYPDFAMWIPKALKNIYFSRVFLTWGKNLCI